MGPVVVSRIAILIIKARVFGYSTGSMIACKIAAIVPDRVLSLTGDFQCFPEESLAFSVFVWNMSTSKIIVRIGPYL
ncbi:hypothetical protein MTR_5g072330 [Medicago truncatula]|uniref:Alpha/Beta hydrolase n=1 Tax=Medicago truncatula TaxID=3880 RepID=G7K768_MEDTR|nr:hypothetical protein MTR_5g072330 [Medicago truncatula]